MAQSANRSSYRSKSRDGRGNPGRNFAPENMQRMMLPGQRAAPVMMSQTERVAHFQLDTARRYTDLFLGNCQSLMEVRDPASFRRFIDRQQDTLREFNEAMTADMQKLSDLGRSFSEDLEEVGEEQARATRETVENTASRAEEATEEAKRTG